MKKLTTLALCSAFLLSAPNIASAKGQKIILSSPVDLDQVSIQKPVGQIVDPEYGVLSFHNGTTFTVNQTDTPIEVFSPYNGKIFFAENNPKTGSVLKIIHDNGYTSTFSGIDLETVDLSNKRLERGEKIGNLLSKDKLQNGTFYFEHIAENGHSVSFLFEELKENNQISFVVKPQNLALAQQYYVPLKKDRNDETSLKPYNFNGTSDTRTQETNKPVRNATNSKYKTLKLNDVKVRSVLENAPTYISMPGGSGVSAAYQSLAFGYSDTIADAAAATATPTCSGAVRQSLMEKSEDTMLRSKALKDAVISEPAQVKDISCFDNYQTVMTTVVPQSGLSGSINVFGSSVSTSDLVQQGMDALSEGACQKTNEMLNSVKNQTLDASALYAGRMANGVNEWERDRTQSLQNKLTNFVPEQYEDQVDGSAGDILDRVKDGYGE